jgi:hypothetical protein
MSQSQDIVAIDEGADTPPRLPTFREKASVMLVGIVALAGITLMCLIYLIAAILL